jgi:sigma-B regulation protein RsbU (phosphoserine phosphatase)
MGVFVVAAILALASLGALLCAVHLGWLARMKSGFLITLLLAVAGSSLGSAFLVGVWAQVTGKRVLFDQVVKSLQGVADVAEAGFHNVVTSAFEDLDQVSRTLPGQLSEGNQKQLAHHLDVITGGGAARPSERGTNKRFLDLEAVDVHGKLFASGGGVETIKPDSVEVAYALEGREFVSHQYVSNVFKKHVLDLATPIRDQNNAIIGALICQYDLEGDFQDLFRSIKFLRDGYAVVVGSDGRIIAHPDASRVNQDISSYLAVQRGLRGETGSLIAVNEAGVRRLFIYRPIRSPATIDPKFWVLLIEIDESEVLQDILKARRQFLPGTAVLAILAVLSAYFISLSIKRPIQTLNQFVQTVQAGRLSARVVIRGRDEIGRLGDALNEMAGGLEERDEIKGALIASHQVLQVARGIQMALLPRAFPAFPDMPQVDIFGTLRPALEVGGDLYHFFALDENRICFMIGDVSDKGVPAALFMAMAQTAFEISAKTILASDGESCRADSIAGVLDQVNRYLIANNDSQMFVTLFAGVLDLRTGSIEYSDGGHEPPFVMRQGAGVEMLKKNGGIALGFTDPYEFPIGTIKLDPGDVLVLYTDGVNEAMNCDRRMFTTSCIGDTLRTISIGKSAEGICETIISKVDEFVHGTPQSDDIAIVVIRFCDRKAAVPAQLTAASLVGLPG